MWYYINVNKNQKEPIQEDEMYHLIKTGVIINSTPVWTNGMSSWLPAQQTKLGTFISQDNKSISSYPQSQSIGAGTNTVKNSGGYQIEFLFTPTNNQTIQNNNIRENRLPLFITNSKAFNNGIQVNKGMDYINRLMSSLKDSNLFSDVRTDSITPGIQSSQYHQIKVTASEIIDDHKNDNTLMVILMVIAGIIFFPLMIIFFFLKNKVDFTQELSIEFISSNGTRMDFSAKTIGRVKFGILSNKEIAGLTLGGSVSTSNINSVINQVLINREKIGL